MGKADRKNNRTSLIPSLHLGRSKNGRGVFASRGLKNGEELIDFRGPILNFNKVETHFSKSAPDRYVQITKRLYMGPSGGLDDFFNHSCNPNAALIVRKKAARLIAIKNIKKNQEIVWDYSTTMDEDTWEHKCNCRAGNCRGIIRDFKYLPLKIRKKYIKLGIVPKYNLKYSN